MLFYSVSGPYERYLNLIGMIYELSVILVAFILLILVYLKYSKKRHKLTLYLLIIFILYFIAVFFSWLSKVFVVLKLDLVVDEYSILGIVYYRIASFRISELMVCIAIFYSYILKVRVFHDEFNKIHRYIVIIFGIIASFYVLVIYDPGDTSLSVLLDAVAFLLVFIYMSMIYFPFMYRSIEAYNGVEEKEYKIAFLSLTVMSISFMLIFLNFLIDRLLMLILDIPGFTLFYFLAWGFAIIGMIGAYMGYIRPKS
ncbi:MAG: hypothetical protein GF317_04245 [Candidatus Lokiarchaeota archaeon]|nr:hypothetical protein [Candidatus Lokiarchaeota archaeon]MBD3199099.1 hypothetical protein [Candidatus Lokiarchaeota archaeon]